MLAFAEFPIETGSSRFGSTITHEAIREGGFETETGSVGDHNERRSV